jgi:Natural resistance-associated macrophage protein
VLPRRLPALAELLPVGPVRGAAAAMSHRFPLPGSASALWQHNAAGRSVPCSSASRSFCLAMRNANAVLLTSCLLLQIAIAATDLAEIIGSATALYLLFGLPVWAGVLITGVVSSTLHPNLHQPVIDTTNMGGCRRWLAVCMSATAAFQHLFHCLQDVLFILFFGTTNFRALEVSHPQIDIT